jgi:hypothetical protein
MWYPDEKHKLLECLERIAGALENLDSNFGQIQTALQQIAINTSPIPSIGPAIAFQILIGGTLIMAAKGKMLAKRATAVPNPITDAPTGQKIAVIGIDAQGAYGAPLASGSTIKMTVANGANGVAATFTPDATPGTFSFVDQNGVQRNSVPSLLSGVLTASTPVDPNDPFIVGYAITKADGTAGGAATVSCSVVPGTEASEVLVFPS